MPQEWYEIPVYYKGNHQNIIGPGRRRPRGRRSPRSSITSWRWRSSSEGQDATSRAATREEHIAGFTVMNDFSARDIQRKEMQVRLGPAKGKDWCTAIGPVLVTPDEIGDPYKLAMTARVNGEKWSDGNSGSISTGSSSR